MALMATGGKSVHASRGMRYAWAPARTRAETIYLPNVPAYRAWLKPLNNWRRIERQLPLTKIIARTSLTAIQIELNILGKFVQETKLILTILSLSQWVKIRSVSIDFRLYHFRMIVTILQLAALCTTFSSNSILAKRLEVVILKPLVLVPSY